MKKIITSLVLVVVASSIMSFVHGFNPSAPVGLVVAASAVLGLIIG